MDYLSLSDHYHHPFPDYGLPIHYLQITPVRFYEKIKKHGEERVEIIQRLRGLPNKELTSNIFIIISIVLLQ